jgi:hypothetical protein
VSALSKIIEQLYRFARKLGTQKRTTVTIRTPQGDRDVDITAAYLHEVLKAIKATLRSFPKRFRAPRRIRKRDPITAFMKPEYVNFFFGEAVPEPAKTQFAILRQAIEALAGRYNTGAAGTESLFPVVDFFGKVMGGETPIYRQLINELITLYLTIMGGTMEVLLPDGKAEKAYPVDVYLAALPSNPSVRPPVNEIFQPCTFRETRGPFMTGAAGSCLRIRHVMKLAQHMFFTKDEVTANAATRERLALYKTAKTTAPVARNNMVDFYRGIHENIKALRAQIKAAMGPGVTIATRRTRKRSPRT